MSTKPHPDLERQSALSDIDYHEAEGLPAAPDAERAKVRREWMMVGTGLAALAVAGPIGGTEQAGPDADDPFDDRLAQPTSGYRPRRSSMGLGARRGLDPMDVAPIHSLFGSSSSSPENSGVMRRECGYTRYVL